ncbi:MULTISPECIES: hypothetical protein [Chryseobacterium]|uniref:Uncharacterized protein n=1 Tax=Chryseobacterium taihuense TaxID=1141221 RepID=A0A4U8WCU3_9FLAO|nr:MULTISPECIES: hypothetical protein [Chryseobacterium]QQV02767.1 hypothetical protein I6I61_17170 [Chryseobacterium sp. FDAARGOS 1104]VFB03963.1 Uncharacterised protein [Chryseobacterium taihuense]
MQCVSGETIDLRIIKNILKHLLKDLINTFCPAKAIPNIEKCRLYSFIKLLSII